MLLTGNTPNVTQLFDVIQFKNLQHGASNLSSPENELRQMEETDTATQTRLERHRLGSAPIAIQAMQATACSRPSRA